MTTEEALGQLAVAARKLPSEHGIKSTLGKRRGLEQTYQIAVRNARRAGVNLGMKSKKKHRTL